LCLILRKHINNVETCWDGWRESPSAALLSLSQQWRILRLPDHETWWRDSGPVW
jgi:hypothetical protein